MGSILSWGEANWFPLLQTLGIVGSLIFNAYVLLLNARVRSVETLFTMTEQHRAIWFKYFEMPRLHRILNENPDLVNHPMTDNEMIFVNLIILHLTTVLIAVQKRAFPKPDGLDIDLREFFSLPIPRIAWNRTKEFRDPKTIQYVERLLKSLVH